MRLIKVFNLCVVFFAVFSFLSKYCLEAADNQCFKIVPFKVGQWVEYQIVSLEEQSKDNRYKISVLNEEIIDGEIYFWIGFDVFNQGKREISFKALMKNFKTENPTTFFVAGFFVIDLESKTESIQLDFFLPDQDKIAIFEHPFDKPKISEEEIKQMQLQPD